MLRRSFTLTSTLLIIAVAQLSWASVQKTEEFSGNLIDAACATKTSGHAEKVKGHPRSCSLMAGCVKSGFGIVTSSGKFLKFDENGDKLALDVLKSSTAEKDVMVNVSATQGGDTLKVIRIEQVASK